MGDVGRGACLAGVMGKSSIVTAAAAAALWLISAVPLEDEVVAVADGGGGPCSQPLPEELPVEPSGELLCRFRSCGYIFTFQ